MELFKGNIFKGEQLRRNVYIGECIYSGVDLLGSEFKWEYLMGNIFNGEQLSVSGFKWEYLRGSAFLGECI